MAKREGPFNELAKRGWRWARDYRPAEHRTDDALFAHTHCEVSEAWRECREGRTEPRWTLTGEQAAEADWVLRDLQHDPDAYLEVARSHGKPEGLPSELADIVIMACIVAGKKKIDLDAAIEEKFGDLDRRLVRKLQRKLA